MKTIQSRSGIVKKMREIRDKVSIDIIDMNLTEEKEYIAKQLSELKIKSRKQQHAI